MKTSFHVLRALIILCALIEIDAVRNNVRRIGKYRPRSPRRYLIKCCTGGCSNPISTNKSRSQRKSTTPFIKGTKIKFKVSATNRPERKLDQPLETTASQKAVDTVADLTDDIQPAPNNNADGNIMLATSPTGIQSGELTEVTYNPTLQSEQESTETVQTAAAITVTSTIMAASSTLSNTTIPTYTMSASTTAMNTSTTAMGSSKSAMSSSTTSIPSTANTATTPKCVMPECQTYKMAQNKKTVAVSGGSTFKACGRNYFISNSTVTVVDAATFCSSMNMTVLTLESVSELFCLLKLIPADKRGMQFWTSAANDGASCAEQGVYAWCSLNQLMPPGLLTPFIKTAKSTSENCLLLNAASKENSSALTHNNCSVTMPYICEPTCMEPKCPSSCVKSASVFNAQGKIDRPDSYGNWIETCNDVYLFGIKIVTWQQNWDTCCSLGMTPLTLDSVTEQDCLSNLTKGTNWTGNYNYWSGGTQQDCRGVWGWCGGVVGLRGISDEVKWEPGQPDNLGGRQDCVHIKNFRGRGLFLTDRNCSDRYLLACKGNPEAKPEKKLPDCPVTTCEKNTTLFDGNALRNFSNYGMWQTGCGKNFLYSKEKATWRQARERCCSMGITLATVQTNGKRNCMGNLAESIDGGVDNETYWVYGTDNGFPGNFHWCSNEKEFDPKETVWAPGEPNSKFHCVYYTNKGVNQSMLATADCNTEKKFLCDVRKKGTGGLAMQQECKEIWGVSIEDIDSLQKAGMSSANYTYQLKCFLKCMGEYAGLFAFGSMVTGNTIKVIEEAATNDPNQLQNGFNTFDECSSFKQDDGCIEAGEVYSCGHKKEPVLVNAIFNTEKGNATVMDPPVPCAAQPRRCVYEGRQPCVTNATLRAQYLATNSTSIGNMTTNEYKKDYYFLSYARPPPLTLKFSYNYCCSLGMRLVDVSDINSYMVYLVVGGGSNIIVGETYQVNATQNAFCRSNKLVLNYECYGGCSNAKPVCEVEDNYMHFFTDRSTFQRGMVSSAKTYVDRFICEDP